MMSQLIGKAKLVLLLWAMVLQLHLMLIWSGSSQDKEARVPNICTSEPPLRTQALKIADQLDLEQIIAVELSGATHLSIFVPTPWIECPM